MSAIDRIDHIVVTAQDITASVHFYVAILGLELDDANGRIACRAGRQKINFHRAKAEFLPAAAHPTFGSANFCLASEGELDVYVDRLAAHGIPLIDEKVYDRNGAKGAMRSLYVRDPDNNLVDISAYGTAPGVNTLALDHFVLDVADMDASVRFYEGLLGFRCLRNGNACTVAFPNGKINLHTGEPPFAPARENVFPGSGDFCLITTENIADIHAALAAAGAPFALQDGVVPRTGAMGPIDSVYLRDPDGNLVEISAYRTQK